MRALDTAATGMAAQDLKVQVIAGNIANMGTTGFKSQRAEFQDLIYEHVQRIGAQASDQGNILPVGIELGSGVKTVGTPRLMTQGTLSQTGNTLDVAIQGSGWFKILMPDGTYNYTRDGSFQMDAQGRIVTAEGNIVQPTITIPPNSTGLTINQQGQVSVTLPELVDVERARPVHDHDFHQRCRPASERRQLVQCHAGLGHAAGRSRRHQRRRHLAARQPRAVERRGGERNLQPDRGATRLRDELQGHHRGGRDAANDVATDEVRKVLTMIGSGIRIFALLFALRRAAPRLRRRAERGSGAARQRHRHRRASSASAISSRMPARPPTFAIFRSPDLGTRGTVPTESIVEAIRPHQLIDIDTRGLAEVIVTRASRAIPVQEISASIAQALAGQYGFGDAAEYHGLLRPRRAHHCKSSRARPAICRCSI